MKGDSKRNSQAVDVKVKWGLPTEIGTKTLL